MIYGYARVSTKSQNEARQITALIDAGVENTNIIVDKQSGKDFNRDGYQNLISRLGEGDVLIVKSLDRLGRNYEEILSEWRTITKEKCADIVILDMPLLDTRSNRDLTGLLISDIVLQLLSYVAHTEREAIRQRQAEGIAIAKENGVHLGRRPMERPSEYEALKRQWKVGEISARAAACRLGITHRTFLNWIEKDERSGYKGTLLYPLKKVEYPCFSGQIRKNGILPRNH